jgi:hypothetical protein
MNDTAIQRPLAEMRYREELEALAAADKGKQRQHDTYTDMGRT